MSVTSMTSHHPALLLRLSALSLRLFHVFDHVPADRGFLMLRDEDGGDRLTPMVVKHRAPGGDQGKITISKTIADRVMKDRVSILTSDAEVERATLIERRRRLPARAAASSPRRPGAERFRTRSRAP